MTSNDVERGFVEGVCRFFRIPREEPRDPARMAPLVGVWLAFSALSAGALAVGWFDLVFLMMLGTVFPLLDEVETGVRHRWPAFVVGLGVGWAVGGLVSAVGPAPADPDWAPYPGLVCGSLAAFVTFVAITRLPQTPRNR